MADVYSIVVEFLHKGGVFIYPISLVFVIGLAIALERWIYLQYEKSRNSYAFKDFLPLLKDTDIEKMQARTRESSAPVIRVIGCGLDMLTVSRQRADVENAMSEGMLETMPRLEQRTNYLGLLANVATLLGLLGTIIGLIGAFEAVAQADPSEKSQMLSTSISVAMNTTAVGLITAIPLLILNGLLQNKTKSIVTGIEMSAVKFLNVMTYRRQIEAGMPRVNQAVGTGGFGATAESMDQSAFANPANGITKSKKDSVEPLAVRLQQTGEALEPGSQQDVKKEASFVGQETGGEAAEVEVEGSHAVNLEQQNGNGFGSTTDTPDSTPQEGVVVQVGSVDVATSSSAPLDAEAVESSVDKDKNNAASGSN